MNDDLKMISEHYIKVWGVQGGKKVWSRGPIDELPYGFHILEVAPHDDREMWTYSTCGMSQSDDAKRLEIHIFSEKPDESLVELLTAIAHYHRTCSFLGLGHTVNFGKPWQGDSQCTYGLLSLPYLDGKELEILENDHGIVQFLWLIPITEKEVEYKKQFGLEKLEDCFETEDFDYLNPRRNSVI